MDTKEVNKMSKNLIQCMKVFSLVARVKNEKLRKKILKAMTCDDHIYRALHELVNNTIKGTIPLTSAQKAKLRRQRKFIQSISCKKASSKQRKEVIVQSGGYLSVIYPIVASLLSNLLTENES
jgi:hypothetical protein